MKEPLKIEAGKWYRARNGEKVFACGPSALGLGMIRVETADETTWRVFAAGGRCFADNPNPSDLIEEWREPITKTTTVYMDRDGVSWVTTQSAPGHAIASVKVTLTEGQFAP